MKISEKSVLQFHPNDSPNSVKTSLNTTSELSGFYHSWCGKLENYTAEPRGQKMFPISSATYNRSPDSTVNLLHSSLCQNRIEMCHYQDGSFCRYHCCSATVTQRCRQKKHSKIKVTFNMLPHLDQKCL